MDRFFQAITRSRISERFVTAAAFAKARIKLKFEVFIELNKLLIERFNTVFQPRTWQGFRLIVIDGTTLTLQTIKEIIEHFGVWKGRQGDPCPTARASQLFDPLNKLTVNAVITPKSIGEREHLRLLLSGILDKSLILLDRGYPAFWLFKLLFFQNIDFCARICSKWKIVRQFVRSGKKEKIILLKPSYSAIKECRESGLDTKSVKLRLIRVELETGEVEVLITSLIDKTTFPQNLFCDLYHERWPVEEDYKIMKCRMEMERFTGQSVLSVYQDFHANIFAKNLVSVLTFPIQTELHSSGFRIKYGHQVNFTQALGKARNLTVLIFQRTNRTAKLIIEEFMDVIFKMTLPIRPGRKFPRKHKSVKRKYYLNYKPIF